MKQQMEMVLQHWLRTNAMGTFPSDLFETIIGRFAYRRGLEQKVKLDDLRGGFVVSRDGTKSPLMNIAIVGHGGSGKSSLIRRYVHDEFKIGPGDLGAHFLMKFIDCPFSAGTLSLMLWDTHDTITDDGALPSCRGGADAVLFCYDTSTWTSLDHLSSIIEEVKQKMGNEPTYMMVGTKCDLEKVCSEQDILSFAEKHGMNRTVECSAKDSINIDAVFNRVITETIFDPQFPFKE